MKHIYDCLRKWKLIFSCVVLSLTLCLTYAAERLSIKDLQSTNTYTPTNFPKVLDSAQKSPNLFTALYNGAPRIFYIIGSGAVQANQAQVLIDVILTSTQINSIKATDGKSMLHAIALCPQKYTNYIEKMVCFLLKRGIDSEMKDKAGLKAEDYLSQRSSKLYLLVRSAVMANQSNSYTFDADQQKEKESSQKYEPITQEEVVQALMNVFSEKGLVSGTVHFGRFARDLTKRL